MKVLVIEDDPKVARFVVRVLTEEGFTVDLCRTGMDGVQQARTGLYDLMVLDWMPLLLPTRLVSHSDDLITVYRGVRSDSRASRVVIRITRKRRSAKK